jgi:uncharacterized coiled-coil protein SlyX
MEQIMEKIMELHDLLGHMGSNLDKLLAIEMEKTAIFETGKIEGLNGIINDEQALIMECSAHEKKRLNLCVCINAKTIEELAERYPQTKLEIEPIYSHLAQTAKKIAKVNKLNMKLIETRLNIIKFMTNQFGISPDNMIYGKNAQVK